MDNKINIVFLDASTIGNTNSIIKITELGNYKNYSTTQEEQKIERIKGNHVVITNKVIIDKDVMDNCKELKLICVSATGLNNIDLEYAKTKGIIVKNVAGYSTESVAQTTFSMLLYLLNKISYFDNYVKSGEYAFSPIFTNHGRSFHEIKGKKYGIVGLGAIGKRVAEIATAFGARVIYYSTSGQNQSKTYRRVSFEELLETSDFISIHCPLNDDTENLFTYEQFKRMKKSSIIINVGRGKIVNEKDLALALDEKLINAAAIDVLENEPIKPNNPLLEIENPESLLITPHIAWTSEEAREELINGIYKNITDWLKTK